MANVQHKDITEPNIHEPKGVKFAPAGTAYVANGTGSGAWVDVLTPGELGVTPAAIFTLDNDLGSTELTNGSLFPGSWSLVSGSWGDARITLLNGFLSVNKTGVYNVTAKYSFLRDSGGLVGTTTLSPTRTSSSLTPLQSLILPAISGVADVEIQQPFTTCTLRLTAGQGIGFWVSLSSGTLKETRIRATVQMTRLSDG